MSVKVLKSVGGAFAKQKDYSSFDFSYYLICNPDVMESGVNPLTHFLRHGWKEGRNPNSVAKTLLAQMKIGIHHRDSRGGKKILNLLDSKGSHFAAPTRPKWRTEVAHYGALAPEAREFLINSIKIEDSDEELIRSASAKLEMSLDDAIDYAARFGSSRGILRRQWQMMTERVEDKQTQHKIKFGPIVHESAFSGANNTNLRGNERNFSEDMTYKCITKDIKDRLNAHLSDGSVTNYPNISVIVPVYDVDIKWLDCMVASVRSQSYKIWELILVDDRSTREIVRDRLVQFASEDARIRTIFRKKMAAYLRQQMTE